MPSSRATLIEVATLAGTSKTSVSRFFGPERDKLSATLQARIGQAAHTLGYQPNLMARGLKGGGSRLLGMLVADIRNPFSVAIVHGVELSAHAQGYSLIVCNTDNDPELEQRHLASLASYQVEGLIVNAAGQPKQPLQALMGSGVPLVLIDREVGQIGAEVIGLDNALAIEMALDHLVQQGYRSVLYASEPPEQASARQERLLRFQQRVASLGLQSEILTCLDERHAVPVLHAFTSAHRTSPCAVLCANGNATLAMARHFQHLRIAMGPVGLIGIDEMDWCALVPPGITTLAQPTDAIGHAAVACLLNQLSRTHPQHAPELPGQYRHAPSLVPRGSTIVRWPQKPGAGPALE
ncbi:substrate-binding domain-containing protein [Vreelandella olivaria]|uniref:LacI family DNA-binding transcriptional regulator n=1 Tax=Vreelandella olivaria TaxID=390919 RepID=UPI00201FA916|nr:substrate-binding domain-containing protein [Halomonas olivaria]